MENNYREDFDEQSDRIYRKGQERAGFLSGNLWAESSSGDGKNVWRVVYFCPKICERALLLHCLDDNRHMLCPFTGLFL